MSAKKLFNSFFPAFTDTKREKPREMFFIVQEMPDTATTLITGDQHTLGLSMVVTRFTGFYGVMEGGYEAQSILRRVLTDPDPRLPRQSAPPNAFCAHAGSMACHIL